MHAGTGHTTKRIEEAEGEAGNADEAEDLKETEHEELDKGRSESEEELDKGRSESEGSCSRAGYATPADLSLTKRRSKRRGASRRRKAT